MTTLLVDSSVLLKWFHEEPDPHHRPARALRSAAQSGRLQARIIDLALYEVGNVLLRRLGWSGADTARQLEILTDLCGAPLVLGAEVLALASRVGADHGLSFYDAAWAAAAEAFGVPLVSVDGALVAAGLAELPSAAATRLEG